MKLSNDLLQLIGTLVPTARQAQSWCERRGYKFISLNITEREDVRSFEISYERDGEVIYFNRAHANWENHCIQILLQAVGLHMAITMMAFGAVMTDPDDSIFRLSNDKVEVYDENNWCVADVFTLEHAVSNIYYFAPWIDWESAYIDRDMMEKLGRSYPNTDILTAH